MKRKLILLFIIGFINEIYPIATKSLLEDDNKNIKYSLILTKELFKSIKDNPQLLSYKADVAVDQADIIFLKKYPFFSNDRNLSQNIQLRFILSDLLLITEFNDPLKLNLLFNKLLSELEKKSASKIRKSAFIYNQMFSVEWQIKGANKVEDTLNAIIEVSIASITDNKDLRMQEIINNIEMPVLDKIAEQINVDASSEINLFVIHHRTIEVANILHKLDNKGVNIESFIGIPYGTLNNEIVGLFDFVTKGRFYTLKKDVNFQGIDEYKYDFENSSLSSFAEEQFMTDLFADCESDYMQAMNALLKVHLLKLIRKSIDQNKKLLIYEDGGYVFPIIYEILNDRNNRDYPLVSQAVKKGTIIGAVEVTSAGDNRDKDIIERTTGEHYFPLVSCARDLFKTIIEGKGVATSCINASETALGNMGLGSFEFRKVAVVGGNGAIGSRVVDELIKRQNSTANVFSVDINPDAIAYKVPLNFYNAAVNFAYKNDNRFNTEASDFIVNNNSLNNSKLLNKKISLFINTEHQRMIINNFWDISSINKFIKIISRTFKQYSELTFSSISNDSISVIFKAMNKNREVVFLRKGVVLNFKDVNHLIANDIDTVIGTTGKNIFSLNDLDTFLSRESFALNDKIILISFSSKDYEFRSVKKVLDELYKISESPDNQSLTADRMKFLQYLENNNIFNFITKGVFNEGKYNFSILRKNLHSLKIKKIFYKNQGLLYKLNIDKTTKYIYMVAEGFPVNFFADFEKGVKTEYIDPVISIQLLSLLKIINNDVKEAGYYRSENTLTLKERGFFWEVIESLTKPLEFKKSA